LTFLFEAGTLLNSKEKAGSAPALPTIFGEQLFTGHSASEMDTPR
jgi:hypothetical protein